jgi:bifunctional non-homologous end joining protein LigD
MAYILDVPLHFVQSRNPTTARTVPAGDAWLHEPKLDGYRLQVINEGRKVRLFSRRGHEWTARFPGLVDELAGIPCRSAILDAELCLPGAGGSSASQERRARSFARRRDYRGPIPSYLQGGRHLSALALGGCDRG